MGRVRGLLGEETDRWVEQERLTDSWSWGGGMGARETDRKMGNQIDRAMDKRGARRD